MSLMAFLLFISIPDPTALEQNKVFWEQQLQNPSPDLRLTAVLKLRDLRFPDTLGKIQPLLNDPDTSVRYEVIRSLSKTTNTEALETLKAALEREKDPYLLSEIRRGIRSIEDSLKAAEAASQKAAELEAKKAAKKARGVSEKSSKSR